METFNHYFFEFGLVIFAFSLGFLCLRLHKFSKGSIFASAFTIFAASGFMLGLAYSIDISLDYLGLEISSLPFFLDFAFIVILTYGVYTIYNGVRKGNIELEKTKEELANTQAQLVKSERLAAIGELAGMIGHDLRNPLMGIRGAIYFLRNKQLDGITEEGLKMLTTIDKCIDYSDKIINDLLDYSSEIRIEPSQVSPSELIKDSMVLVHIPNKVNVIYESQMAPEIMVDIPKIKRVFTNIIKNAFDAMPNGGSLTIKSQKGKDSVIFSFTDTGVGMTQEALNKLWTPLFTTKARGMGFGLAICKRIVEAHQGTITVRTIKGKRTTFRVLLPIETKMENKIESSVDFSESGLETNKIYL